MVGVLALAPLLPPFALADSINFRVIDRRICEAHMGYCSLELESVGNYFLLKCPGQLFLMTSQDLSQTVVHMEDSPKIAEFDSIFYM